MKSKSIIVSFAFLIIAFLVMLSFFVGYYGDWLWFRNMGFGAVFTTILWAKVLLFFAFFPHIWHFCLGEHCHCKGTGSPYPLLERDFP